MSTLIFDFFYLYSVSFTFILFILPLFCFFYLYSVYFTFILFFYLYSVYFTFILFLLPLFCFFYLYSVSFTFILFIKAHLLYFFNPTLSSEESLAYNKGREENCYHVYNFNQSIECRPCSVLERIPFISDYCSLVSFRAFSPMLSIFNQLFCIVPGSPSVVHHKGEHKPYYDEPYKKPCKSFRTQEESHQQGHKYSKNLALPFHGVQLL